MLRKLDQVIASYNRMLNHFALLWMVVLLLLGLIFVSTIGVTTSSTSRSMAAALIVIIIMPVGLLNALTFIRELVRRLTGDNSRESANKPS